MPDLRSLARRDRSLPGSGPLPRLRFLLDRLRARGSQARSSEGVIVGVGVGLRLGVGLRGQEEQADREESRRGRLVLTGTAGFRPRTRGRTDLIQAVAAAALRGL